ncbi:hypothetical protein F4820DRAFT_432875, partial [Hypoxylon rubiginosum]
MYLIMLMLIDKIPLTTFSKIDRRARSALPLTPSKNRRRTEDAQVWNETENKLKGIWERVLPRVRGDDVGGEKAGLRLRIHLPSSIAIPRGENGSVEEEEAAGMQTHLVAALEYIGR